MPNIWERNRFCLKMYIRCSAKFLLRLINVLGMSFSIYIFKNIHKEIKNI